MSLNYLKEGPALFMLTPPEIESKVEDFIGPEEQPVIFPCY
jgi:hypothetical protein